MKKFLHLLKERVPRWLHRFCWSWLILGIILFVSLKHQGKSYWSTEGTLWQEAVGSDGLGYYSYLPATFIYHDHEYHFIDSLQGKYRSVFGSGNCGFCNRFEGKPVNKYFVGESVALTPFFLLGDVITRSTGEPRDGYSYWYMVSVCAGALFYLFLGLLAVRKLLRRRGVHEFKIAIVLGAIFFGTTLFHYTLWQPSFTHVYSFGLISLFALLLDLLCERFRPRLFLLLAFVYGLIIIIRPVNGICILCLPFLAGSWPALKEFFMNVFRRWPYLIGAAIIFGAMIFIQAWIYHKECGKWYVYAYDEEGFDFLHPHFFQCLFSYNNGTFVYAPLLLVMFFGVVTLRKELFKLISFLLFFTATVWVISSWWAWSYGGSFGMRPMVDYYCFFALLFGLLLKNVRWPGFAAVTLIMIPLVWYMQFQTWQYRFGMIIWDGMTKEKYWRVFLHDEVQFTYINTEPPPTPIPANTKVLYHYFNDFEKQDTTTAWETVKEGHMYSGKYSSHFIDPKLSAPYWKHKMQEILPDSVYVGRYLWLGVKMKVKLDDNGTNAQLLIRRQHEGQDQLFFNSYMIRQLHKENEWMTYEMNVFLQPMEPQDELFVFPNKEDSTAVYIDDFEVTVYQQQ